MVFKATGPGNMHSFAVKFVEKPYGVEAHELAMKMNYAPSLVACAKVLPHYLAIVMEWVECRDIEALDFPIILPQIKEFLKIFHGNGMVHGDLRRNNLKVTLDGKRLVVLDFDWAGKEGVVLYPPFMNLDISWPPNAKTGHFVRREHDLFWVEKQFMNNEPGSKQP
jgi:serine/threonine protein kinase